MVTNETTNILNGTYDLTSIVGGTDVVSQPVDWLVSFNGQTNGLFSLIFVILVSLGLFLLARQNENISDTKAGVYTGFIMSVVVGIAFAITSTAGVKLISWLTYAPILFITAIFILLDYANRRF